MNTDIIILGIVGISTVWLLIRTMIKSFKTGKCSSCSGCENNTCDKY